VKQESPEFSVADSGECQVNIPGNWLKKNLPSLKEKLTKQGVSKIFSNNLHEELENTLKLKSYLSRVEWSYG
jgi:hypothetical protein